jgi:hypothetical protein
MATVALSGLASRLARLPRSVRTTSSTAVAACKDARGGVPRSGSPPPLPWWMGGDPGGWRGPCAVWPLQGP